MESPWMNDHEITDLPSTLDTIRQETERVGFTLGSEPKTGALLRALAASKPGGQFLELGTGTGVGTAWLLSGMDAGSHLSRSIATPRYRISRGGVLGTTRESRFISGTAASSLERQRFSSSTSSM